MSEASINDRVAAVMSEIKKIPKNGRNQHSRYDYATADDVYATIRPILARHQLTIKHETSAPVVQEAVGGKKACFIPIRVWFDGEAIPSTHTYIPLLFATPQGVQAAVTYGVKYWLRGRLLIDTGEEDADAQSTDEPATEPAPTRLVVPSNVSPIQCDADGKIELRGGGDVMQQQTDKELLRAVYSAAVYELDANNPQFVAINMPIMRALPKSGREAIAKRLEGNEALAQALLKEETI